MKAITLLIILGGLAYGGKWMYDNGYFDSITESFNNTVSRTESFVNDDAVNNTNFDAQGNPVE